MNISAEYEGYLNVTGDKNVAALLVVAKTLSEISFEIKYLGGGDNADERGAMEFLAMEMKDGLREIAQSLESKD